MGHFLHLPRRLWCASHWEAIERTCAPHLVSRIWCIGEREAREDAVENGAGVNCTDAGRSGTMAEEDLEGFVAAARAFDPSPGEATMEQARAFNEEIAGAEDLLARKPHELLPIFHLLHVQHKTLAWLYLLEAVAKNASQATYERMLVEKFQTFVGSCCHVQLKANPAKFSYVTRTYTQTMVRIGCARQAILYLQAAVEKARPSEEHLTPQAVDLLQACAVSKCYSYGNRFLSQAVYEVDPGKTGCNASDVLLYFYYGALVLLGEKRFHEAKCLLRQAVGMPATVVSAIVVEAYKKFILVSLISEGVVDSLPKCTPTVVQRQLKGFAMEYIALADAYKRRQTQLLLGEVESHRSLFKKDGNFGLVKQCVSSFYRSNIQRLTKTYLTLSLKDIAKAAELSTEKEAEEYVLRMIDNKDIFAKIDQREGMVHFQEDPDNYGSQASLEKLDGVMRKLKDVVGRIQQTDRNVSLDKNFVSKMLMKDKFGAILEEGGVLDTAAFAQD
eukprot:scaffold649_cov347-Pavlova_lutheri.AAC.149